jgi:Mrp family chromosome partitioning ATPase
MARVLDQLRAAARIVIFDTPPLQAVTDAAVLGASLDGAVLVAHSGRTGRVATQAAADALRRVDARLLGVTLNLAGKGWVNAYGYYGGKGNDDRPEPIDLAGGGGGPRATLERTIRAEMTSGEPPANR